MFTLPDLPVETQPEPEVSKMLLFIVLYQCKAGDPQIPNSHQVFPLKKSQAMSHFTDTCLLHWSCWLSLKICLLSATFHGLLTPLLYICGVLQLTVLVNTNIPGSIWNFLPLLPSQSWDSTHIYQRNHAAGSCLITHSQGDRNYKEENHCKQCLNQLDTLDLSHT